MVRHPLLAGLGLMLAALLIGLAAQAALAGGKLEPVKVEASASKPDANGKQTITVKVNIEKGWHIYANPVDHEDLAPAQTVVSIKAAGKPITAKVKYPGGKSYIDKAVGTYKIYEDDVTIQAELQKASGPLEVSVKFTACDDKRCLPPKTVKLNVP